MTSNDGTASGLAALLERNRFVLTVGAGGVGKTTASAALAVAAAIKLSARVLVLTIDPAKRLADAVGIQVGNAPQVVPTAAFESIGVRPAGELSVSMLDTETGWADLIARNSPDADVRDAILHNRLFQNLTGRFVHSHGYLAMERLWDVSDEYDLVVIDTPPSRNTLDILDAPAKMTEFFGSGLLRWLIAPYRSRLFSAASRPFYMVADRVLGDRFLADITEFFILFQQLAPAFNAHAAEVEELLRTDAGFAVVTTLERAPVAEAEYLVDEIGRRGLRLAGTIANRTLPAALSGPETAATVSALSEPLAMSAAIDIAESAPDVPSNQSNTGHTPCGHTPSGDTASGHTASQSTSDAAVPIPMTADGVVATLSRLATQAPTVLELARREAAQRARLIKAAGGLEPIDLPLRGRGVEDLDGIVRLLGLTGDPTGRPRRRAVRRT